jgi:hypothetical protein
VRKRAPAWKSIVGRRIKVHDRHQIELKVEYQPKSGERHSTYIVETFVCVPASLNISRDTVAREQLYADIHNYMRLKTPELSWSELDALPSSPMVRLVDAIVSAGKGGDVRRLAYDAKLTACIFRGNLRDLALAVEREASRLRGGGPEDMARIAELLDEQLDGARSQAARYREIVAAAGQLPESSLAALRMGDEYISVTLEQYLRKVIVSLARARLEPPAFAAANALKKRLLGVILDEERYRKEQRYPTIIDPHGDNEPYVYRAGLLKKFCSSALFLAIRRGQARRTWQELLFAIAAGIAMAFATVIAFWAQSVHGAIGLQLFLILVVAYMFKDRIKEGARGIFSRWLERGFYDRKIVIDDPAGGTLGLCREKIHYSDKTQVPADVIELRSRGMDPATRLATLELDETIIHYKKEVKLSSQRLEDHSGLTDIVRFHIARLLHDMDEPDQEIEYIDEATQALGPVRAAKTYHVDIVFRFTKGRGEPPQNTLMRLILDRNGIRRIERTDGTESAA